MKNLIIADNQDISRIGLRSLAVNYDAISSIHEAKDKAAIVKYLMFHPDSIIILDYVLSDFSSANELLILHERFPQSRWILFSDDLSEPFVRTLIFTSQAFSIVLKTSKIHEIRMAFTAAIQDDRFICSQITDLLLNSGQSVENLSVHESLTPTEKEILKAIAQGKTTKEIAYERNSSFHTIMTHRKNIFRKLDVNNIHEAVKYALRAGLIDTAEYYI